MNDRSISHKEQPNREQSTAVTQRQAMPTVKVARIAVLIALSAVGSFIKIPSLTGTVALDSAPGYLGALAFGSKEGALIAALGHLFSAATVGFPLTVPLHIFVAVQMAVWSALFGYVYRRFNAVSAVVIGVLLNGVVSPALFALLPGFGVAFFSGMVWSLIIASAVNIVFSVILFSGLRKAKVL